MAVLPDFEYDIFISYRQNDNQSGWVTGFVQHLNEELAATLKEPISVYFDSNPHGGLHEHHQVDDSLRQKLKCLVLIPIVSRTYCDINSFAWSNEFKVFIEQARTDQFGLKVKVAGGNVSNRVLPIRIHELESEDLKLFESEIEGVMRSIDFIYKESGVNRPLLPTHDRKDNLANTDYGNQINKVANAIREIITHLKLADAHTKDAKEQSSSDSPPRKKVEIVKEFKQRNVLRAGLMYVIVGLLLWKITDIITDLTALPKAVVSGVLLLLVVGFPIAIALAWLYERSPGGFIRIGSEASRENPFSRYEKKPLTSNTFMLVLFGTLLALFFIFPKAIFRSDAGMKASQASVAVIPFINNTGSADLDYYGMGLASEIRTQLAVAKQFDFISSMQATAAFKNSEEAPKVIGAKLGVTHLVSGMYQGKENNLQVIVELVEIAYHYFNLPNDTSVTREMITPLMDYIDTHFEDSWEKNEAKGIYAYWVERDYEKGRQLFLDVLKVNPESEWANALLRPIYRRRMQYKEALQYGSKAAKQQNSPGNWRDLGLVFRDNGDFENAEIAYRNTFDLNNKVFDVLYSLKQSQNKLEDLPEVVKRSCGGTFKADLYMQRRDYKSLLKFTNEVALDSTFNELSLPYYKAEAYFAMGREDSARMYAKAYFKVRTKKPELKLVNEYFATGKDAPMHGILGEKIELRELLPFPEKQIEQDLALQAYIMYYELNHLVYLREYQKAAEKLEQTNRYFPLFGNYIWLNLPMYDRIKNEYPRFQEVINGLKIPPKVAEASRLKM